MATLPYFTVFPFTPHLYLLTLEKYVRYITKRRPMLYVGQPHGPNCLLSTSCLSTRSKGSDFSFTCCYHSAFLLTCAVAMSQDVFLPGVFVYAGSWYQITVSVTVAVPQHEKHNHINLQQRQLPSTQESQSIILRSMLPWHRDHPPKIMDAGCDRLVAVSVQKKPI